MAEGGASMRDKKERKKLGAQWKAMTEEEQVTVVLKTILIYICSICHIFNPLHNQHFSVLFPQCLVNTFVYNKLTCFMFSLHGMINWRYLGKSMRNKKLAMMKS